jgi:amidohydrolase
MLQQEIKQLANKIYSTVAENRRHLHRYPELSFDEHETAAFVKARLNEMGITWQAMANTGVLGIIKGEQLSDEVIALRADMDALRITELNEVEYASTKNGLMHACGHDAHTSSLLGTAKILQSLKSKFGGTIKLIFQPGEEELPGGASLMIKDGVLENPKPTAVIGQHVMPKLEAGKIGIRKGKYMASKDDLYVTVFGKGGHGAQPHENIDPVLITAQIIMALQQVVSRMANPSIASVLSFGKLVADGTTNIIPGKVYMEGTFRTLDEDWRKKAHEQMKKIASGIAESMGGSCEFNIVPGYPFLINEEKLTEQVRMYAQEYVGKENVVDLDIWMASEDFAYYSQVTDACFYMLGAGNKEKGITASLHTPTFNIDEDALALSTGLMAYIAIKRLGNK